MTSDVYWDPYDVEIDAHPHDIWKRMRDEAPVYRNDRYDFWALSRFHDIDVAHRDPATFSSAHGTVLELMGDAPLNTGMMIFMDPPEHTRNRSLVSRAFTPRRVSGLEPHIRQLSRDLLGKWQPGQPFDLIEDFGAQLPSMVITELLGVDLADRAMVKGWIDKMFHLEPGIGMVNDTSFTAGIALHEYLAERMEERRDDPRDDLLTALVQAEVPDVDGTPQQLTLDAATRFATLLISAGTETVARLIGWAAVLLDRHPDQRADLVADPTLIPNAVEELLRYEAPSPVQGRYTTAEVTMHGTTIPAGSRVLLLTGSAGRDEREYEDPDHFDVRRNFDRHLSFGYGIHFCVGAALARLEARIALEEMLARDPEWKLDRDAAVQLHTSTVRGWSSLPVAV
ncbi:MAG: cytochrome P450 [Aquihabitans sp.]